MTWANQVRILKQNFEALGSTLGGSFINFLKPMVKALNSAIAKLREFAVAVSNSLGVIFGWKYEQSGGGVTSDIEDSTDGMADNLGSAADNAKKLKSYLLGIDELNVLNEDSDSGTSGGGASAGAGSAAQDQWTKTDSILKDFESDLDSLYKLGDFIGQKLTDAMNSIDWESVYEGARDFGSGLASFLNGLISPDLFGAVGRTIAGALNTAIYAALSFGETFGWENLGESIAEGINEFFATFDFAGLANTLNVWVQGLRESITTALGNVEWGTVYDGIIEFLEEIDIETIELVIGAIAIKKILGLHLASAALSMIGTSISRSIAQSIASKLGIELAANAGIRTALGAGLTKAFSGIGITFMAGLQGLFGNGAATSALAFINPIIVGITGIGSAIAGVTLAVTNFFSMWENGFSWLKEALMILGVAITAVGAVILGAPAVVAGVVAGIVASIGTIAIVIHDNWETISAWFEENIYPWFSAEKWYELGNGILEGLQLKWEELKEWWSNTAIVKWWEESVAPWFTLEKWSELYNSIKDSLIEKWEETSEWWKTSALVKWWNEHVAPWFKKEKWLEMMGKVPTAFKETFKNAANAAIGILNNFIDWINEKMHIQWDDIKVLGKTIVPSGSFQLFTLQHIPQFETGGFPQKYSLFMAGENGIPEIAGTVGGKTAVAGGAEITGIREAVIQTSNEEMQLLREQNELLRMLLEKDMSVNIGDKDIVESYNRGRRRMGYSFT